VQALACPWRGWFNFTANRCRCPFATRDCELTLPLMPFVPLSGVMRQRKACHRGPSLQKRVVLLILSSLEHPLCFELDLPDLLLRNIQLFTELCEGSRFTVVQPVPTHQYILGSLR
jgi:hypothetical protein